MSSGHSIQKTFGLGDMWRFGWPFPLYGPLSHQGLIVRHQSEGWRSLWCQIDSLISLITNIIDISREEWADQQKSTAIQHSLKKLEIEKKKFLTLFINSENRFPNTNSLVLNQQAYYPVKSIAVRKLLSWNIPAQQISKVWEFMT